MLAGNLFRWQPAVPRTDLSAKRNIGLVLSHLLGWSRVLFLDDDITELDPADVLRASGMLSTHAAVGLRIGGFPDHSVVCHAYRQAGGPQQSFIGGGALAVQVERCNSFFPEIYNDDWFFLLDGDKGIQPSASTGRVVQYPYDPFRNPDRARAEEFGDVLAEGIYWLLDQELSLADADQAHWARFLVKRRLFVERVVGMVTAADLEPAERGRRIAALKGSLGRLARITPQMCEDYLQAWRTDRQEWQRHLQGLPTGLDRVAALTLLSGDDAPPLNWQPRRRRSRPLAGTWRPVRWLLTRFPVRAPGRASQAAPDCSAPSRRRPLIRSVAPSVRASWSTRTSPFLIAASGRQP